MVSAESLMRQAPCNGGSSVPDTSYADVFPLAAQWRLAVGFLMIVLLAHGVVFTWAPQPLVVLPELTSIFEGALFGIQLATAAVLAVFVPAYGDRNLHLLVAAFLFAAVAQGVFVLTTHIMAGHALVWPPAGLHAWLEMVVRLGFAVLVACYAHSVRGHQPREMRWLSPAGMMAFGALLAGGLAVWMLRVADRPGDTLAYGELAWLEVAVAVVPAALSAVAMALLWSRRRLRAIDIWLLVGLAVGIVQAMAPLMWQEHEAPGVPFERFINLAVAAALLAMVLAETAQIYHAQRRANRRLDRLAHSDSLTGLANRRHYDHELERACRRAEREQTWVSLLMLDVDRFKQYNDLYGHQQGDQCLREIGYVLAHQMRRPDDLACRYGGEEFALILYGCDPQGAYNVALDLQGSVEALDLPHRGSAHQRVTVTIGMASLHLTAVDASASDRLAQTADAALYDGKRGGRNTVRCRILPYREGRDAAAHGVSETE